MARQPIDEKCVPIHLGFWQYGFNATYTLSLPLSHFIEVNTRESKMKLPDEDVIYYL